MALNGVVKDVRIDLMACTQPNFHVTALPLTHPHTNEDTTRTSRTVRSWAVGSDMDVCGEWEVAPYPARDVIPCLSIGHGRTSRLSPEA